NPKGIDAVIQSLQVDLSALPWLEKSFGRAWLFNEENAKIPKAYSGQGEYLNVLPNDFLKAQSFIAAAASESVEQFRKTTISDLERTLQVIFWVNLKEIDPNEDSIFTERLKNEAELIIK